MSHTIGSITTRHVSMDGMACYRLEMRLTGWAAAASPVTDGVHCKLRKVSINEMPVGLLGQRGLLGGGRGGILHTYHFMTSAGELLCASISFSTSSTPYRR